MSGIFFLLLCAATCPDPTALFIAAALHEGAHLLCAFFLHMGRPRLRLCPAGLRLEYPHTASPARRILLCLSGPAASIVLSALFYRWHYFSLISASLGILNLLPVSGFDGGGVLEEICTMLFLPDTSWRLCRLSSVICTLLLWFLSVFIQLKAGSNLTLMAVSLMLVVTILSDKA